MKGWYNPIRLGVLLLGVAAVAGCTTIPQQPADVSDKAPPLTEIDPHPYRIGVGDTIIISVWRNPELSQNIGVRPDGFVSMPLMGDLKADGQRPEELAAQISSALSDIIRNPEVTVIVSNPTSQEYMNRVRATGQVAQPVSVPFKQGMTVMDLVLGAGGVTDFGAANRAVLHRKVDGTYQLYSVKLGDILEQGDMTTNYQLRPNDIVSIPKKQLLKGEF